MSKQQKSILIALLIFFIPKTPFAFEIKTGYDLYKYIKILQSVTQNPQKNLSEGDYINVAYAAGLLRACLDTLVLTQAYTLENIFPMNKYTEKEREELSKQINLLQVNIPKNGIPNEQFMLIYIKYAEKYPGNLSHSPHACVWASLVDSYGLK